MPNYEPSHSSVWPSRNKANDPIIMCMKESLVSSLQNKIISAELGSDRSKVRRGSMLLPWAQNASALDLAARLYQDLLEGHSKGGKMKHLTGNRGGPQAKDGSQSFASEIPGEHIQHLSGKAVSLLTFPCTSPPLSPPASRALLRPSSGRNSARGQPGKSEQFQET